MSSLRERMLKVIDVMCLGSRAGMAKALGAKQKTFNNHLLPDEEDKLWQYLPNLLATFSRVSRQWLYFGEGPMLIGADVPLDRPVPLHAVAEAIEAMAADAKGVDKSIYHYIAGLPAGGGGGESSQETVFLRQRVADLERIIAVQEESLRLYREREPSDVPDKVPERAAPTGSGAAPLSRGGSE